MSKIFKPRRGSKAVMQSSKGNTVLAAGEMFVEFEGAVGNSLASIKFGDGSTAYSSLPYALKNVDPTSTAITITPDGSTTSAAALNNVVSNAALGSMIGSLKQAISLTKTEINTSVDSRLSVNNTPFYFDYQNSKYGYNTSPTREAASFHPFREPHTATYTASSRNASLDMGEDHIYRYVNTTNVPNNNTTTYTYAANSTGGTVDMGATNVYRYVNAANVYNKGKADGVTIHTGTYTPTSRAASLDMGQKHTYRYVNTNSVPNTNSGTYTLTDSDYGLTKDMGATNTYRYVKAPSKPTFLVQDTGGPYTIPIKCNAAISVCIAAADTGWYSGTRAYVSVDLKKNGTKIEAYSVGTSIDDRGTAFTMGVQTFMVACNVGDVISLQMTDNCGTWGATMSISMV